MAIQHVKGDFFDGEHSAQHRDFGFRDSAPMGRHDRAPDRPTEDSQITDHYAHGGESHPHGHSIVHVERKPDGRMIEHHAHGGHTVHHPHGMVSHHHHDGSPVHAAHGGFAHDEEAEYVHRPENEHLIHRADGGSATFDDAGTRRSDQSGQRYEYSPAQPGPDLSQVTNAPVGGNIARWWRGQPAMPAASSQNASTDTDGMEAPTPSSHHMPMGEGAVTGRGMASEDAPMQMGEGARTRNTPAPAPRSSQPVKPVRRQAAQSKGQSDADMLMDYWNGASNPTVDGARSYLAAHQNGYAHGGRIRRADGDEAEDKRMIKKAFSEHDRELHHGEHTELHLAHGGFAGRRVRLPRDMNPAGERPHSPINTPPRNPNVTSSPANDMAGGQMPYGVQPSSEPSGGDMAQMHRGGRTRK